MASAFNLKIPKQRPYVLASSGVAVSCPADTTEDILATITVPGGAMGANGAVRIVTCWSTSSTTTAARALGVRFGGISGVLFSTLNLTANSAQTMLFTYIKNRNSASQVGGNKSGAFGGTSSLVFPTSSLETQNPQDIVITGQKTVAGDTLTLESYIVEIL